MDTTEKTTGKYMYVSVKGHSLTIVNVHCSLNKDLGMPQGT